LNLYNAKEIKEELFNKVRNNILPLESLFVFGTNAENLKEIIKVLKEEKQEKDLGQEFIINKDAEKRLLLIPVYKESDKIFAEEKEPQKFGINKNDFNLAKSMFNYIGPKIALAKYECDVRVVEKANESFGTPDQYFDFEEIRTISEPDLLVDRILNYFSVKDKEFDKFKELENEIVHFKRIKFSDGEKFEQIKKKIEEIKHYPEKQKELDEQYGKMPREEFARKQRSLFEAQDFEYKGKKLKIKYIQNHYYIPLIVSEDEKVDYINHIINVPSEVKFIEQLEEYLQNENNVFNQFDWWMFSKLDQTLDEVYIPYYNPKENNMARFKPDFIFWMQKGNEYLILFVDPKGTENTDGLRKIDGYSRIFENKKYPYNGLDINTQVLLKPAYGGIAGVPENYKKYWFDHFDDFATKLNI
jgi:type III restriction enzyme